MPPFSTEMPEFILFGDSLTEWSFSEETQGFGLFLRQQYQRKVRIVNEGRSKHFLSRSSQVNCIPTLDTLFIATVTTDKARRQHGYV